MFSHGLQFSFFKLSLHLRCKIGSYLLFCLLTSYFTTQDFHFCLWSHSFHLFVCVVLRYRRNISAMGCSLTLQGKIGNFVNPISLTPLNAIFADRPQFLHFDIFRFRCFFFYLYISDFSFFSILKGYSPCNISDFFNL